MADAWIETITALTTVVIASMALYLLTGRLGKSTEGTGSKYEAFSGGEELPQQRGKYHSELFVYAALFMVFEVFALLIAAAVASSSATWPLLFTGTGAAVIFSAVVWFTKAGGSQLA